MVNFAVGLSEIVGKSLWVVQDRKTAVSRHISVDISSSIISHPVFLFQRVFSLCLLAAVHAVH